MTKNIAHRGYSALYPENTMLAFEQAIQAGCDGIELDVQLALDGTAVIIHDETVDRTTNGAGSVEGFAYSQLRALDAGKGEKIPTLQEYLELVKKLDIITNIELKNSICRYPGMEELVIGMVREYGLEDRVILSSFNHYSIIMCKQIAPHIPRGLLYDCWLVNAGAYVKSNGANFAHPHYSSITPEMVEETRSNGVGINTWTVDDAEVACNLFRLGINGLVTNNPANMRGIMQSYVAGAG